VLLGPQPPPIIEGLKGTPPTIFNSNQKHTKQFMQEFTLYKIINQESPVMCNAYTRMVLALSFMRGTAINNWVMQQIERLYLRCNKDVASGIGLTHQTNDKNL